MIWRRPRRPAASLAAFVLLLLVIAPGTGAAHLGDPGLVARPAPPTWSGVPTSFEAASSHPGSTNDLDLNWTHWNVSGAPPLRNFGAMAYDSTDRETVVFGGLGQSGMLGDTWAYTNGSWRELCTGTSVAPSCAVEPPADTYPTMADDPADGGIVLVESTGVTWAFANGTWSDSHANRSMTDTDAMVFDSLLGQVLWFGGNPSASSGSTYEYTRGNWTPLGSAGPEPAPRSRAAFFVDLADRYAVLFGGTSGSSTPLGDMWTFDGTIWRHLTPTVLPPAGTVAESSYDPNFGYGLVLVGGVAENYTWAFDRGNWTNQTAFLPLSPGPADMWKMTYDAADGYSLLLGDGGTTTLNDTWILWGPLHAKANVSAIPIDLGESLTYSYIVWGGVPPYTIQFSTTPPGCAQAPTPQNLSTLVCRPSSSGPTQFTLVGSALLGGNISLVTPVTVNPDPVASAIGLPNPATVSVGIDFQGGATGGTSPFIVNWSFGDGGFADTNVSTHVYRSSGPRAVSYRTVDARGFTSWANFTVEIHPPTSAGIVANVSVTDVELPIAFESTGGNGTPPYSEIWTFGDGNRSLLADPSHVYSVAGQYTAELEIVDSLGVAGWANFTEQVNPDPRLSATVGVVATTIATPVTFSAAGAGGTLPYNVTWEFGDGNSTTVDDATHEFARAGNYTAIVTLVDAAGFRLSKTFEIQVGPIPQTGTLPNKPTGGLSSLEDYLLGAATVVAVVVVGVWWRRRRPVETAPPAGKAGASPDGMLLSESEGTEGESPSGGSPP